MRSALTAAARVDAAVGAALCAAFLLLYLATLCPTVYWYDSAEYATAAYTRGVPHPPGYPLYTLLAHVFAQLPLAPAHAVNLMSAVFGAAAVGLCFAAARAAGASRAGAAVGAALLGTGASFWHNATVAEVYTPGLCFALGVFALLARAHAKSSVRTAVVAAFVAGLGLGVHYAIATLGLGFAWLVAASVPSATPRTRAVRTVQALAACALATALGFAIACSYFALLAADDGVPNYAQPSSAARMLWLLSGGNYRLWFVEQYAAFDRVARVARLLSSELSPVGAAFGVLGVAWLARRARALAVGLGLAVLGNVAFFYRYRVDDLEVFLLPSVALLCVAAAVFASHALPDSARIPRAARGALPVVMAALCALRVAGGYRARDLSGYTAARDYGERVSRSLPDRAVILNYTTPEEWRYDAVFGMYFQHVLGRRRDVIVLAHADRPVIDRLLAERRPVFLYTPVAHVAREYTLVQAGDLQRVIARR